MSQGGYRRGALRETAMNFDFGVAQKLMAGDVRPRLFFGPDDIPQLRQALATPMGKRFWRRFREKCDYLAVLASKASPAELVGSLANDVLWEFCSLAVYALLTEDERALVACRHILTNVHAMDKVVADKGRGHLGYGFARFFAQGYDIVAPFLSADERRQFCDWGTRRVIKDILPELDPRFFFNPGANIPIMGVLNLHSMAITLQGDAFATVEPAHLERLNLFVETALGGAICTDGYPWEDIGYGTYIFSTLAYNVECARRLGLADIAAHLPRYYKFGRAILHFMQPWGTHLCNTGDHGSDFTGREFALPRLAAATNDPALLWLCQMKRRHIKYHHGRGKELPDTKVHDEAALGGWRQMPATLPTLLALPSLAAAKRPSAARVPTAFCDRNRGLVSFRSGWGNDDTLLTFDGSQRSDGAQGHHHASAGHFSLSALGEYFAIDTGRYNTEQSDHSVTLVHGAGRPEHLDWYQCNYAGMLIEYAPHAFVDSAAADSTVQHDVHKAQRRIGLVKGPGVPSYTWVVDDINIGGLKYGNGEKGRFDWQLQTAPENRIATRQRGATITGFRYGNLLDVDLFFPLFPNDPKSPDAHRMVEVFQDISRPKAVRYLGFDKPGGIEAKVGLYKRPSVMIHGPVYERPRLVARYEGWNGRSLALLMPRRKGAKKPQIRQLTAALPGTIGVAITFPDFTDTVIIGFDHPMLVADGIDERGDWCVVRRRHSDGRIVARVVSKNR